MASKSLTLIMGFLYLSRANAGPGSGHSHGPEGEQNMQALGILIILALAGGVVWFLYNRKK